MLDPREVAGVYHQISPAEVVAPDGSIVSTSSATTTQLMYSADGYFSFVVTPTERPQMPGPNRPDLNDVPDDAVRGAIKDVVVLTGRYELGDNVVDHHVDVALNPNFNGGTVHRDMFLDVDGADLTLGFVMDDAGNRRRVRFARTS